MEQIQIDDTFDYKALPRSLTENKPGSVILWMGLIEIVFLTIYSSDFWINNFRGDHYSIYFRKVRHQRRH